jgi:hypothetical protein
MAQASYMRDQLAYRREVMARTIAGSTQSAWAASQLACADYVLTKHDGQTTAVTLLKVYEAMPPGTGDLCIDAADWVAGWTAARVLGCTFAVLRRTPAGVQMMAYGVTCDGKTLPKLEVASGVVEVRMPAAWFAAEVELPNGQTWEHLRTMQS